MLPAAGEVRNFTSGDGDIAESRRLNDELGDNSGDPLVESGRWAIRSRERFSFDKVK